VSERLAWHGIGLLSVLWKSARRLPCRVNRPGRGVVDCDPMVAATPTPAHPDFVPRGSRGGTHTRGRRPADVVALIASDAELLEYVRYSSYGVATSYPKGDYDLDGDVDASDTTALQNFIGGAGGWNLDFNRDGNTDSDDVTEHTSYRTGYTGGSGGRGTLSRSAIRNRLGYAGYHYDDTISAYHVRHRVYLPEIGRWSRRDPAGYVDGMSLFLMAAAGNSNAVDPDGLRATPVGLNWWFPPPTGPILYPRIPARQGPKSPPPIAECPSLTNDPDIVAAMQDLARACPGLRINWKLERGLPDQGSTTPTGACVVNITISPPTNPNMPADLRRIACDTLKTTILHELRHAWQACAAYDFCDVVSKYVNPIRWNEFIDRWNDPDNFLCREIDAYCRERANVGKCAGGVPSPDGVDSICADACTSAGNPPGCISRCRLIAPSCIDGISLY